METTISVDPSVTRTGVAIFDPVGDIIHTEAICKRHKLNTRQSARRILHRVRELVVEYEAETVIVEIPGNEYANRAGQRSMSVWAFCCGVVWNGLVGMILESNVYAYSRTDWGGNRKKSLLQMEVIAEYPNYDPKADGKGMDISDAIRMYMHHVYKLEMEKIK